MQGLLRFLFNFVVKWGLLAVALLVTAAISGYLSMRQAVRSGEVLVPTLEGRTLEDASHELSQLGLLLEKSGERNDERLPEGRILSQDPPGGAKLKRNRKVRVIVSLGMEILQVPDLVGQPARRAQIALQQSGLKVGKMAYAHSEGMAGDSVVAQEPPPGSHRLREGSVDLLVSKGTRPRVWVMPVVEGQSLRRVTRLFSEAGFRVGTVRWEPAPGIPPGIVTKQYPPSGFPLSEVDSISLVVSEEMEEDD